MYDFSALYFSHRLGKAKEGFSVFGVLNKCVSAPGKQLLKMWLMRPLVDLKQITVRQDMVELFLHNAEVARTLSDSLKHLKDLRRVIRVLKTPSCSMNIQEWTDLHQTLQVRIMAIRIRSSVDCFQEGGGGGHTRQRPPT
jgi:DNA mismatch repair ATPase MutS